MSADSSLLYISTSSVITDDTLDSVERLTEITKKIELSGGNDHDVNLLAKLIKIKRQKGVRFLLHGYFPPPPKHFLLNFADTGRQTRNFIKNSIRYVQSLNIDYYSIHAGFKRDFEINNELLINPERKHYSLDNIYENIIWFKKEFPNIKLTLENLYPNNCNKECCFFTHINEIVDLLENSKDIYLLLDLGHLKLSSRILEFNYLNAIEHIFNKFNDRIIEIHLSENKGKSDDHELVLSDSIQYMIVYDSAQIL